MIQRVQFSRSEPEFRNRQRLALLIEEVQSTVPAHVLSSASVGLLNDARRMLDVPYPGTTYKGLQTLEYCRLLVEVIDSAGVVYWKAGWFWSSSEPTTRVLCVARSVKEKIEWERRDDFIRWTR